MKDTELLINVINYNKEKYLAFKNNSSFKINKDYEKILNARYHKVSRVKRRLLFLLINYNYIWFCTFTFSDNYINKSDRTKRDLIKNVINTHDFKYILNIDYGKTTEREHYHCILATNENIDVSQFIDVFYPCFSKSILCKNGADDFIRLSKYINKLTNHCLKSTTKSQRLVYNFKGFDDFSPIKREQTLLYKMYLDMFCGTGVSVPQLDKGDTTGNFCKKY